MEPYCTFSTAAPVSYQIIGDNVDLHQKASEMTMSARNREHHWFQLYAARNRITKDDLADEEPKASIKDLPLSTWLPSSQDRASLRKDFIVLIGRVLIKYFPEFACWKDVIPDHIEHEHFTETKEKSELVSACVNCMHIYIR